MKVSVTVPGRLLMQRRDANAVLSCYIKL